MSVLKIIQGIINVAGSDGTEIGNVGDSLKVNIGDDAKFSFGGDFPTDTFNRFRVSTINNLFEYTFKYDIDFDVYWSTELSSGGTNSHDADLVSRELTVTSSSGSRSVMQTRRYLEYYSGKSHLFFFSANPKGAQSNINKCLGLYDDDNGIFFFLKGLNPFLVIRTKTSGSVVDNEIARADWNGDKLDGTGESGFTADFNDNTVFAIDYAWLGAGTVRWFIMLDGQFILLHQENISARQELPYTQSGHLPFRVEIENAGGGVASSLMTTCCAFAVEGEVAKIGKVRPYDTGINEITISNEEGVFLGRINPSYKYSSAKIEKLSLIIATSSDEVLLRVYFNPSYNGTPSWTNESNSIMQTASNAGSLNNISGFVIDSEYVRTGDSGNVRLDFTDLFYGRDIDNIPDEFLITADSLNGSADISLSIAHREFY